MHAQRTRRFVPVASIDGLGIITVASLQSDRYLRDSSSRHVRRLLKLLVRADPCCYCGGPGGTIDHVVPKSRGGLNAWSNMAGACWLCNNEKKSVTLLDFLLLRGELAVSGSTEGES
jgi:5-methylcytosine-specific restriction endonuclease McrA